MKINRFKKEFENHIFPQLISQSKEKQKKKNMYKFGKGNMTIKKKKIKEENTEQFLKRLI